MSLFAPYRSQTEEYTESMNELTRSQVTAVLNSPTVAQTQSCPGGPTPQLHDLIALIEHLHELGVEIAVPLAGLLYLVSGYYWMRGTLEAQDTAKQLFLNTTIGLAIVLLSGSLIQVVTQPLCEGAV